MFNLSSRQIQAFAWGLASAVCAAAFIAWGNSNFWNFSHLNAYQIFPLLGLLAFSLMWTHYVIGTLKEFTTSHQDALKDYYRWTGYAVLALICLHPGLLIYQLFHDGAGLPPGSYEKYVAPGLGWVTLLGTASLLIFLAFELHRVFGKRSWWHYVVDLSDLAMLAIVYHGLRLGSQLQRGWFHYVWWLYAIVLAAILIRKYAVRLGLGMQKAQP
jgi:hypothetical protein